MGSKPDAIIRGMTLREYNREAMRRYYAKHKNDPDFWQRKRETNRRYWNKHKSEASWREKQKQSWQIKYANLKADPERYAKNMKRIGDWRKKNRPRVNVWMKRYGSNKKYHQSLRQKVLSHYGGQKPVCKCCGESNTAFLTIDHINGGGSQHRKRVRTDFYGWLVRENYPKGFQLLCFNCNSAKHIYGICPHKGGQRALEVYIHGQNV